MEKITLGRQFWGPFIIQALVLLGAGWGYATAQEHRVTIIEETLKLHASTIQMLAETERMLTTQINEIQQTQARLITLEEFTHKAVFVRTTK